MASTEHGITSAEGMMIAYKNSQTWALSARFEALDCRPMMPMLPPESGR
jgi:hypothetical protein